MAEERASLYRVVFITAAATCGVMFLAVMIFLLSSRQTGAPTLAEEGAEAVLTASAKVPTKVGYREDLAFFNPVSGEPAIWYYKSPDGIYDLFDAPGFHPTYGREAPLQVVTSTIVGDIEASFSKEALRSRTVSAPRPPAVPRPSPAPRPAVAPRAADPPAPVAPVVRSITIPAGTRLEVILGRRLSTETNRVGDTFPVTLARGMVIGGETVLEQGTGLTGNIIDLERPGRVSGVGKMTLVLQSADGVPIQTAPLMFEGEASKGDDALKVGIGAGIGAAVGALFGGGSGAAKGTAIGAGAGAGQVLATRGEDLVLHPEQELVFALATNATIETK